MDPSSLLFLGLMIFMFYFLLIRPQQRRLKQRAALVDSVQAGDEIVTVGGIYGAVTAVEDSVLWLEVADGTVIKVTRQAVASKVSADPVAGDEAEAESEAQEEQA